MITILGFNAIVDGFLRVTDWRLGQAVFNVASMVSGRHMAGTLHDPFYNDDNVVAFVQWLTDEGIIV
jgi:hypothetical protein